MEWQLLPYYRVIKLQFLGDWLETQHDSIHTHCTTDTSCHQWSVPTLSDWRWDKPGCEGWFLLWILMIDHIWSTTDNLCLYGMCILFPFSCSLMASMLEMERQSLHSMSRENWDQCWRDLRYNLAWKDLITIPHIHTHTLSYSYISLYICTYLAHYHAYTKTCPHTHIFHLTYPHVHVLYAHIHTPLPPPTHTPHPPPHPPQTSTNTVCRVCGGQGFIMCLWCEGSKKGIRNAFGDLKCTVCNKNALQKCPECSMWLSHDSITNHQLTIPSIFITCSSQLLSISP